MSSKIYQDKTFPRHVSDLMNLMHMMVFQGTDGEETWDTYLNLKQKEYIALGLAKYYQCEHCIDHHIAAVQRLDSSKRGSIGQNVNAMVLFLRIDTRHIGQDEKDHWIAAWNRFAQTLATTHNDPLLPYLIGFGIGIARDDAFLIEFCGMQLCPLLKNKGIEPRKVIGEIEAVVIFMKAAASKNRVVSKVEQLLEVCKSA